MNENKTESPTQDILSNKYSIVFQNLFYFHPALIYTTPPRQSLYEHAGKASSIDKRFDRAKQYKGLFLAYQFVEDHLLARLREKTVISDDEFITWLKKINQLMSESIQTLDMSYTGNHTSPSGEFSKDFVHRWLPNLDMFFPVFYYLLKQQNLKETAQGMQKLGLTFEASIQFLRLLDRAASFPDDKLTKAYLKTLPADQKNPAHIVLAKLAAAYHQDKLNPLEKKLVDDVVCLGQFPAVIPKKMQEFASTTLASFKKLQQGNASLEDVATVIAEIYSNFLVIYPFNFKNEQTAACLVNTLLLTLKLPPLIFFNQALKAFKEKTVLKTIFFTALKDAMENGPFSDSDLQDYIVLCSLNAECIEIIQRYEPNFNASFEAMEQLTNQTPLTVDHMAMISESALGLDCLRERLLYDKLKDYLTGLKRELVSKKTMVERSLLISPADRMLAKVTLKKLTKLDWGISKSRAFCVFNNKAAAEDMRDWFIANQITSLEHTDITKVAEKEESKTERSQRPHCLFCGNLSLNNLKKAKSFAATKHTTYFAKLTAFDSKIITNALSPMLTVAALTSDKMDVLESGLQCFNLYNGYLFAQNTLLPELRARAITASELIHWIQQLHGIVGSYGKHEKSAGKYTDIDIRTYWRQGAVGESLFAKLFLGHDIQEEADMIEFQPVGSLQDYKNLMLLAKKMFNNPSIILVDNTINPYPKSHPYYKPTQAFAKLSFAYTHQKLSPKEKAVVDKLVCFFPLASEIPKMMSDYAENLLKMWKVCTSTDQESIVLLASTAYKDLLKIHPFADANGRLATLLMNLILCYFGQPSIVLRRDVDEGIPNRPYFQAVQALIDGNQRPFQELVTHRLQHPEEIMIDATLAQRTTLRMAIADLIQQIQQQVAKIHGVIEIEAYFTVIMEHVPEQLRKENLTAIEDIKLLEHIHRHFVNLFENISLKESYQQPRSNAGLLALMQTEPATAEEPAVSFRM